MKFRLTKGNFLKTGAYIDGDSAIFTFAAEKEDACSIVLLDKSGNTACELDIPGEYSTGSLYSVRVHGFCGNEYAYYFRINGKRCIDPYATRIFGREKWNDKTRSDNDYEIACGIDSSDFDWKNDSFPEITRDRMKLYKLHVRGFSMDTAGDKKHKGTFEAVSDRINYIKKLGFTSILLMPVYEFEEMTIPVKHDIPEYAKPKYSLKDEQSVHTENDKVNFWGYTSGNYFAVKASYASDASDASNELRRLVERLHKNGMECIVEMYFPDRTDHNLILDALRYWVMSFHVDGFKLLGDRLPVTAIVQDALLSRTKILYDGFDMSVVPQNRTYENLYIDKEEYQFAARMMLNHINCNMYELLNQQKKQGENVGFINYISSNNGFTLSDLFMYNDRHNEANGEKNADGPSWNFSNNYGCEGPSRKRFIREIRKLKWKDAMLLLFLAQGVPMIMAGDEICNSQDGNNNAYCQDNIISWLDWTRKEKHKDVFEFFKYMIAFRKRFHIITDSRGKATCSYPPVSIHSNVAWSAKYYDDTRMIGVMYAGVSLKQQGLDEFVYFGVNAYWDYVNVELPDLPEGYHWKLYVNTGNEPQDVILEDRNVILYDRRINMAGRSVIVAVGERY